MTGYRPAGRSSGIGGGPPTDHAVTLSAAQPLPMLQFWSIFWSTPAMLGTAGSSCRSRCLGDGRVKMLPPIKSIAYRRGLLFKDTKLRNLPMQRWRGERYSTRAF